MLMYIIKIGYPSRSIPLIVCNPQGLVWKYFSHILMVLRNKPEITFWDG